MVVMGEKHGDFGKGPSHSDKMRAKAVRQAAEAQNKSGKSDSEGPCAVTVLAGLGTLTGLAVTAAQYLS